MVCKRSFVTVTLLAVACVGLTGCGAYKGNPEDIMAFTKPYQANVTSDNYVLQPPDEVEVRCTKVPEIHLQRQRIRSDGKISFEGLGEIEVAGKTIGEVTDVLEQKVAELYKLTSDNPIDVRVAAPESKKYFVVGEVGRPGPKPYTGRDTVLSALVEAIPRPTAWEERVIVVRPSERAGVEPRLFNINYFHMVERGDSTMNVLLQEGDVVYVPPTILASVGYVLGEFLSPIGQALNAAWMWTRVQSGTGGY